VGLRGEKSPGAGEAGLLAGESKRWQLGFSGLAEGDNSAESGYFCPCEWLQVRLGMKSCTE